MPRVASCAQAKTGVSSLESERILGFPRFCGVTGGFSQGAISLFAAGAVYAVSCILV